MHRIASPIFDVIILGSGGAGCAAALEAINEVDRVILLTRDTFLNSKTARAQGGIQAPISDHDSPDVHFQDTMKAGEYENEAVLVRVLVDNAASTIAWLEDLGVPFDKNNGQYRLQNAAGLSFPRILSSGDDSGNHIIAPLMKALESSNVSVKEHSAVYSLSKDDGVFTVNVLNRHSGEKCSYLGRTVIIAAGGAIPAKKKAGLSLPGNEDIPDSLQLAEQIGAKVVNPDLVQYHPTGIINPPELRRKPVPEVLRAAGADLLNANLVPFTDSMKTRKALCDDIVKECQAGRCVETADGRKGVWLNTPGIDRLNGAGYTAKHFNKLYTEMLKYGHDITISPILVYPIAHYSLGGISINCEASTNIEGLFAAGEAAYGIHGKDRLMGNSLLDIFVFGRIAGRSAAKYAKHAPGKRYG